ncbi:MAG: cytochrome bd-I oxidase subunit CydX [Roseibium sp.]
MWYFTWTLGLFAAAIFAVVNAMWLEFQEDNGRQTAEIPAAASKRTGGRHG